MRDIWNTPTSPLPYMPFMHVHVVYTYVLFGRSFLRAGARKSGREGEARIVKPEERVDHMPHTQNYPVEDVLVDLLEVGRCENGYNYLDWEGAGGDETKVGSGRSS